MNDITIAQGLFLTLSEFLPAANSDLSYCLKIPKFFSEAKKKARPELIMVCIKNNAPLVVL
jgi:hypothetical protein